MNTTEFPLQMICRTGIKQFRVSDVVTLDDVEFFLSSTETFKKWDGMPVLAVAKDPYFEELLRRATVMEGNLPLPSLGDIEIRSLPVLLKTADVWIQEVLLRITEAKQTEQPE